MFSIVSLLKGSNKAIASVRAKPSIAPQEGQLHYLQIGFESVMYKKGLKKKSSVRNLVNGQTNDPDNLLQVFICTCSPRRIGPGSHSNGESPDPLDRAPRQGRSIASLIVFY
ncbi:hypothetical protein QL285_005860 [Trifolium repens]|nr:hypothetical protein QL285_005860 [Trifolium repens]